MKDFQEEMRLQAAEIVEDNTEFPVENDSDEKIAVKQIVEALPEYEIEELEEKTEAPAFVEVHPITNKPVIVEHIPEIQVVLDIATELQPPHEKLIVDSAPEAPINEIIVNDPISAVVLPVVLPEVATLPVEIPEKVVEPVKIPEKIVEPVKVPIVPTLPVKVPIVPAVTEKVPIVPAVPEKVSEVATLPVEIAEETVVPTKSPQDVIPPAPVKQTVKRVKNQNKIKKFVQKKTPVV